MCLKSNDSLGNSTLKMNVMSVDGEIFSSKTLFNYFVLIIIKSMELRVKVMVGLQVFECFLFFFRNFVMEYIAFYFYFLRFEFSFSFLSFLFSFSFIFSVLFSPFFFSINNNSHQISERHFSTNTDWQYILFMPHFHRQRYQHPFLHQSVQWDFPLTLMYILWQNV